MRTSTESGVRSVAGGSPVRPPYNRTTMWLLLAILAVALWLLISQRVSIEITALGLVVALAASGILSPEEALAGFASEATLTVAAMFVLSAGLTRTGSLDAAASLLVRVAGASPRRLLLALLPMVAIPSAFLNNTPVVLIFIPVLLSLSRRIGTSPSKVFIPLSYFAILGGTLTLVGTSTNIVVDSVWRQAGGEGLSMFDFTPLGLAYLAVGAVLIVTLGPKVLPDRTVLSQLLEPSQRSNFVTEIAIEEGSRWAGTTLAELMGAEEGESARILELIRDEEVILSPSREVELTDGDTLLVEGSPRAIHRLLQTQGVDLASAVADSERVKINRIDLLTVEAVVTPNSRLIGQKLPEIGLNRRFGVKVLAVQRLGRHHRILLRGMRLREGDVLLVQGEPASLKLWQDRGDVLLIEGVEKTLTLPRKTPVALGILAAVVTVGAAGITPLPIAAIAGAAAMMLTGCLRVGEAVASLESSVLLLIAGTIPLGTAMVRTGLADSVAHGVLTVADGTSPVLLVAVLYLVTACLTEVLSNNASAVLLTPIAIALAEQTGLPAKGLVLAVAFGASASFVLPIGYQTNLLVMGPGGYRFSDYARLGVPLSLALFAVATVLIPILWL